MNIDELAEKIYRHPNLQDGKLFCATDVAELMGCTLQQAVSAVAKMVQNIWVREEPANHGTRQYSIHDPRRMFCFPIKETGMTERAFPPREWVLAEQRAEREGA